ncbi:MAG TPA: CHASE3 domain-containing protein [Longimicrobium sp.]|nr:CHASE3 domain-containing protein [Longimicrobium sp.]
MVILLLALVTYASIRRSREMTAWVRHTDRVMLLIDHTLADLTDAETGQRGYLLTGDPRYLAPYRQGAARYAGHISTLRALTADNPRQQAHLRELGRLGAAKLDELRHTVEVYRAGNTAGAQAEVRSGRGERLMERIRAVTAAMYGEEARLLRDREARERRWRTGVVWAIVASGLTGAGLALLIGTLFSRYAAALQRDAQSLAHRAREENALAEVARRLSGAHDTDELLQRIADGALYATRAHGAFVERVDAARTFVRVAAGAGEGLPPIGTSIPYPGSLAADVLERDQPEWIPNVAAESRPIAAALDSCCHRCAALVVPLISEGDALGALVLLGQPERLPFDPDAVARARTLADLAAVALRRAILLTEAKAASQAKSAFLATMSHEMRTPINAVLGYAELLEMGIDGALNEHQLQRVVRVRAGALHLRTLVDDILDLSRIEAGRMDVVRTAVPLRAVARSAAEMLEPAVAARGVRLTDGSECGDDVLFHGDEDRVLQILLNLLSNAIRFTPAGGDVRIRCRIASAAELPPQLSPGAGWACIDVTDTGIGIPAEDQERIFEAFVQLESGYTRTEEGSGIGLSISRHLARLMGGELTVRSRPGQGSCFTLWLPAA